MVISSAQRPTCYLHAAFRDRKSLRGYTRARSWAADSPWTKVQRGDDVYQGAFFLGARETVIDMTWARVTDPLVSRGYLKTVLGNGGGRRLLSGRLGIGGI